MGRKFICLAHALFLGHSSGILNPQKLQCVEFREFSAKVRNNGLGHDDSSEIFKYDVVN